MRARESGTSTSARADYLEGDPAESRPIRGGRLAVDPSGIRFRGPGGAELRLPLDGLLGISVSGRAAERRRRRAIHGTMHVAGLRRGQPAEWVFAVDRSAATRLRRRVDRELVSRGRSRLPFVEELDGFPLRRPPARGAPPNEGISPKGNSGELEPASARSRQLSIAELGHRLNSLAVDRSSRSRRRILPWALLGAVLIAVEVIVPLVLLRGG